MKRYLALLIILFSCTLIKDKKVYKDVDPTKEKVEIYFFQSKELIEQIGPLLNVELIDGFKISDQKVIEEIVNSWSFPEAGKWKGFPVYKLELSKENKTFSTKSINEDLTIISSHGKHLSFSQNELLKFKGHLIPLNEQLLRINKRSDAISFIATIRENGGYLRFHNSEELVYPFEKWEGKMTINYPKSLIPEASEEPFEYVQKLLPFDTEMISARLNLNELTKEEKRIDPSKDAIKQQEAIDQKQKEGATVSIEFYCNKPKPLPDDFIVTDDWKELENIEYYVYNLNSEELVELGRENKIEIIKN